MESYNIIEEHIKEIGRFKVHLDTIKIGDIIQPFSYVSIKHGVTILPIIDNRVVAIRQYRYPIRRWMLELPGGVIDEDEEPIDAAIRELREETGYTVREMVPMGMHYPSYGATDEKVYLFVAICDKKCNKDLEAAELIDNAEVTLQEFKRYIQNGDIHHSSSIILYYGIGIKIIYEERQNEQLFNRTVRRSNYSYQCQSCRRYQCCGEK